MEKLFITLIVATMLVSCKSTHGVAKADTAELKANMISEQFVEANKWELVKFKGANPKEMGFTHKTPTLVINKSENRVGGNSGCNSFGGELIIEDNTIRFDKIFSTKMYCDGVPEREFFQLLEHSLQYQFEANTLQLLKENTVVLEFKKVE